MKREGEGEEGFEEGFEEEGEEGQGMGGSVSQPLVAPGEGAGGEGREGDRRGGEGEDQRPLWEGRSTKLLQGSQKKVCIEIFEDNDNALSL